MVGGHGAAQVGTQGFVAFVFDDAVLVEAGYEVAAVVRDDDVESDEPGAQGVADAAQQVIDAGAVEGGDADDGQRGRFAFQHDW